MSLKTRLRGFVDARANAWLRAAGHSGPMAKEAKREAAGWVRSRSRALSRRRRLYGGWGIVWTDAGHGTVELRPIELPGAAQGEVTLEVLASAVSPGTERANYLRLPNAQPHIPHRPGYSVAGRVVAVGPGVEGLQAGDRVAATGAPHASLVTVAAGEVHPIPDGVDFPAAATIMLGIISTQGVEHARIAPGEAVCVVGAGPIGVLAQRIAAARGAGQMTIVAASRRREAIARSGGADFLVANDPGVAELGAPVVIEATGSPAAIPTAIGAAGASGRVVLLGSARGSTAGFPVTAIREKALEIVGAHVDTLRYESELTGVNRKAQVAREYLTALGDGSVAVDDIVDERLDPREAEIFYRRLAKGSDVLGAVFDWGLLPAGERVWRASLARIPDITGRGVDAARRAAPPARGTKRVRSLASDDDPFAGAQGNLRFGIVGCGDIAVNNAAAIAAAPNTTLAACFDLARPLAERLAAEHDTEVAGSFEELLGRTDVDAVFLSVPHHLHSPLAEQAAAAGKHVVVEKPPANDLRSAVSMVTAAEDAGVVLSVCFPHRYQPDIVAARRLIASGALGEISGLTAELLMDRSPAYWLGGFTGRSLSDWRSSREKAGGGVLVMNLSHYVDLLYHLTGLEVAEVSAYGKSAGGAEVEDSIAVTMRLANDAVGSVIGTTEARGSLFTQIRIWGNLGQVAVEHQPRFYTLRSVDGLRTTRWQQFGHLPSVDMRALFVSRLATAIATGAPPDIPGRGTLGPQAFMEAAYVSMDTGRPVRPAELLEEVAT